MKASQAGEGALGPRHRCELFEGQADHVERERERHVEQMPAAISQTQRCLGCERPDANLVARDLPIELTLMRSAGQPHLAIQTLDATVADPMKDDGGGCIGLARSAAQLSRKVDGALQRVAQTAQAPESPQRIPMRRQIELERIPSCVRNERVARQRHFAMEPKRLAFWRIVADRGTRHVPRQGQHPALARGIECKVRDPHRHGGGDGDVVGA